MKQFLTLVLAAGTITGFAQKPETYAKTITPADLRRHLYIVASAEMEGRETATPGQRRAAAYIESQFRQIGLEPGNNGSYQMEFDVYQDSLLNAGLSVNGKAFQLDRDFNPALTNNTSTLRFSEIVVIGTGSADSLRQANLNGRLVLVLGNVPMGGRGAASGLAGILQQKGIAGILQLSNVYPRKTPAGRKGGQSINSFRRVQPPQQYTISEEVARAIVGSDYDNVKGNTALVRTVSANVELDLRKTTVSAKSSNVIGVVPGTDLRDEYLVITAHYDHLGKRDTVIYYGADDDGSGTVGVIELAEAFARAKAAGKGPRRTVVFMTVSGEEKGLWGSEVYGSRPIFPLEKTTANLNIDMIGRSDASRKVGDSTNYVYVVGDDKLSSDLRPISEGANKKYVKMELDYKFNDPSDPNRIYFRSDHYNFAKHGVPIIFYYDGMLGADYHRPTDTPDKINYNLLAKRAQLVFYTAWEMANRNAMLKRDVPLDTSFMTR
jgi:hypothetical protein